MSWAVKVSSSAEKRFLRLDSKAQGRILKGIEDLSRLKNPLEHKDVKPLTGELKGFCRLRIGKFRVIFHLLSADNVIAVVNIASRGSVY